MMRFRRWIIGILAALAAIIIVLTIAARMAFNTDTIPAGAVQKSVTSKDGTLIAYEQTGTGQPVIIVAAALADRGGARRLAGHMAEHFTVINYDRRGRGKSTNSLPYAVEREIEDVEALIDASGGTALLFGSSSGAVLALDTTSKLGSKVKRAFLYEPPFIVDDSRPPMADTLIGEVTELTASGRRNDAVKLFFAKGMGIPEPAVNVMRYLMPGWSTMAAMAHTIPYDLTILGGTQSGKPLPAGRWAAATAPTMVAVGSLSEPFFHHGAQALAQVLPNAQYRSLEGRDHSAILFASKALADAAAQFFAAENAARSSVRGQPGPPVRSRRVQVRARSFRIAEFPAGLPFDELHSK